MSARGKRESGRASPRDAHLDGDKANCAACKGISLTVSTISSPRADFTGISAPYEAPDKPEIHIKTDSTSIEEGVKLMVEYLQKHNYI